MRFPNLPRTFNLTTKTGSWAGGLKNHYAGFVGEKRNRFLLFRVMVLFDAVRIFAIVVPKRLRYANYAGILGLPVRGNGSVRPGCFCGYEFGGPAVRCGDPAPYDDLTSWFEL